MAPVFVVCDYTQSKHREKIAFLANFHLRGLPQFLPFVPITEHTLLSSKSVFKVWKPHLSFESLMQSCHLPRQLLDHGIKKESSEMQHHRPMVSSQFSSQNELFSKSDTCHIQNTMHLLSMINVQPPSDFGGRGGRKGFFHKVLGLVLPELNALIHKYNTKLYQSEIPVG